jgi:membrane-bound PQQ-dependent dehydrogenase (glucose/quinate/shikimate family)
MGFCLENLYHDGPMLESQRPSIHRLLILLLLFPGILSSPSALSQEWRHYGSDLAATKYSSLDQISRQNVHLLKVAWTYHTGDISNGTAGSPVRSAFECTPLVVDGVMYLTTPFSRVMALDAESGKPIWTFDPELDKQRPYNLFINRGVAYWERERARRIFLGTLDGRLFCLDAANGKPVASFGSNGFVNLRAGVADQFPERQYGMTSPPLVYRDLVICGSLVPDGQPQGPSGDVRAFDALTGKLVWRFHTVPKPGEIGHDTWEKDSWKDRGGTNVWSLMSCDEERGIVFLPLTSPAPDFYGGERKGQNLFGDSLVALNARTGKRLWHYQIVHHNLWDWDLPAQPNLVTLNRGGKQVPAVAQITKMGFLFVFDRLTGQPLFDVEERPVPPSEVPGEQAWPTQPFPTKPRSVARQSMNLDELTSVTPESRAECLTVVENARFGEMYQPHGLDYTILFPGTNGGPNWGGASYDPASSTLFVNSMDVGQVLKMVKAPEGKLSYRPRSIPNGRFWDSNQYPCQQPPWGTLTAINLNTGEFRWRVTLGVVDELLARGIPPTGTSNLGGSIVTAGGLVFIAATNDSRFRAFDKDTGKELWVTRLPASGHATPMTFRGKQTGRQFVVIAAGGGNKYNKTLSDVLVAFALP